MHLDMNRPDRDLKPGIDLWLVMECKPDKSQKGDPMLKVKLCRVRDEGDHIYDNIMLGGGGWGIGKKKLVALGVPAGFSGDFDPLSLVDRFVWVATVKETTPKGTERLSVNIAQLKYAGLQPKEMVPDGCTLPTMSEVEERPF